MRLADIAVALSFIIAVAGCSSSDSNVAHSGAPDPIPTIKPTPTVIASVKTRKVNGENQLEYIELDVTGLSEPMVKLSTALRQDVKASRFRVYWWLGRSQFDVSSTVLYNRHNHTLIYYSQGFEGVIDMPHTKVNDHYLYTGVTDNVIHKLAHDVYQNRISRQTRAAGFDLLPLYGCKQQKRS